MFFIGLPSTLLAVFMCNSITIVGVGVPITYKIRKSDYVHYFEQQGVNFNCMVTNVCT